jgi:hypothetical protein
MDFASDRISGQVRLAAASLLGVTWGLLIGQPAALVDVTRRLSTVVLVVGLLAVLALTFDFLQYVFAYILSKRLHDVLTAAKQMEGTYEYGSFWWRGRWYMFWGKQIAILAAVTLFLFVVVAFIFN